MNKIQIILLPNGTTACTVDGKKQYPELQQSWLLLYAYFLQTKGFDPREVEITMPNGMMAKIVDQPDGEEGGLNWTLT